VPRVRSIPYSVYNDPRTFATTFALRSGVTATLRAIRSDDRERLQAAFLALEPESVYLRYFSYKQALTQADLDRLCNPDFESRVVLVVTVQQGGAEVIVGSGGYVRKPPVDGVIAAEVAFAVEEDVQRQGIATRLLAALTGIARASAIARFDAEVLSRNAGMLQVFHESALPQTTSSGRDGVSQVQMDLRVSPTGTA
jgi:RimJ/RimL family protein N-acetyltransferase